MARLMHTCQRCSIQVQHSHAYCPVCGHFITLVDSIKIKPSYPIPNYLKVRQRQTRLLLSLLSIPFFIGLLLSIGIDLFLIEIGFSSTMLMSFFLLYGYIILFETILKDNTLGTILIYHALALLIGFFIFPTLSLTLDNPLIMDVFIPLLITTLNVLFFIFAWIQRRSHLLLLQMLIISIFGLFYGFLNYPYVTLDIFLLMLVISSLINGIFVFTFFRKKFISFLSRWLHI